MPKDDFYTPTDIDALHMENELLAFEVRFLKAQLAEPPERSMKQLEDRLARLERVETDLILLLRRQANSPLGWFFRLWPGFRTLEQRYLSTDA